MTMKTTREEKRAMLQRYFADTIEEFLNDIQDMEFREEDGKVIVTDDIGRDFDVVEEWNINPHEPLDV